MYEFRTTDAYDVAKKIATAVGSGYGINIKSESANVMDDYRVVTAIIEITNERFRMVNSDDDEEYYKRFNHLLHEALKQYHVMSAKRLQLKIDFVRSQEGPEAWLAVEYCVEAENQDGEAYWDYFESLEDLQGDFEIYLSCRRVVK